MGVLKDSNVNITNAGNYSVTGISGTLAAIKVFSVGINTVIPISNTSSSFPINSSTTLTLIVISPTVNVTQTIYPHVVGSFSGANNTMVYPSSNSGVYHYCVTDGLLCSLCWI